MKKNILKFLTVMVLSTVCTTAFAKVTASQELANAIKLYKAGNYSECYTTVDDAIKKDPSNPLCYYYKAMASAQIGKKSEAIENYEKTLALSSDKSNLVKYAKKGKRCLESPDSCQDSIYDSEDDKFIRGPVPSGFSEEVMGLFEKLKIEQMMRNMNHDDNIDPQRFREYKDFSSMKNPSSTPTNDEIVAAFRTLQNAGLLNFGNNTYSDLSLLNGSDDSMNNGLMDLTKMNPQLIQAMFTSNMSLGF